MSGVMISWLLLSGLRLWGSCSLDTVVRCGIWVSVFITGIWDLLGDAFLFLSLPRCCGAVAYLDLSFKLLWRDMMLRLYLSDHITISSISRKTYWSRFLQVQLRYAFQHLILHPFPLLYWLSSFSSRMLALLLLVRPWKSRLILRGLRLRELVILSILRQCVERPHLALLWVTSHFWIVPCTTGLLLFRLLSSSISVSMQHSLLYFLHRMHLMWV